MAKKDKAVKKSKGVVEEFKAFITRGNVLGMAVGVIIGGAFSAIVTALVNILLSVCTWAVPGGLKGLVTVLPAVNTAQAGMDPSIGLDQSFAADNLQDLAAALAKKTYSGADGTSAAVIEAQKSAIVGKYTLHGTTYYYNGSALIDWGTFINAIISFIVIALVLFLIIKTVAKVKEANAELKARVQEEYYVQHPEERPAPVVPGQPAPTEMDILIQIRDELKKNSPAESSAK
jgi:large conductance mechanosensitive channel